MLIRFAVENYKSFKERQIFSMAAGKQTRHPSHCVTINGKRLLKSSFFFGANASGKSNFVHAIDFMHRIVLLGTNAIEYSDQHFRIDTECKGKPGVFQVDFTADDKFYSYGYAISYSTHEIEAEWLYRLNSNDNEICVFERQKNKKIKTDTTFNKEARIRFNIYSEDVKSDELLLKTIGDKDFRGISGFEDFISSFDWFKRITVIYPESIFGNRNEFFLDSASNNDLLVKMLRFFDTGIQDIKEGKQLAEKALSFLPDDVRIKILNDIVQELNQPHRKSKSIRFDANDYQFNFSLENGALFAEKMMFNHGNDSDLFEVSDESDGTKRLFDLIPMYYLGQKETIFIVDELDRSFHSKLTENFIKLFFRMTKGNPSQLICTTHDANLMDLNILRQDEIWFVERDENHASQIYSLSDYKQRFDTNILNNYLLGRYGAIPCFNEEDIE